MKHIAMRACASLFRRFTDTNLYGTGSVKIWKTCHKVSAIFGFFYSVYRHVTTDMLHVSSVNNIHIILSDFILLARDVIYTSRAYVTMSVSVCLSVCLSVTEVHWHIIANLGFEFRSKFTANCRRGERSYRYASHR